MSPDNEQYPASSTLELFTFCLIPVQKASKTGQIMFFAEKK